MHPLRFLRYPKRRNVECLWKRILSFCHKNKNGGESWMKAIVAEKTKNRITTSMTSREKCISLRSTIRWPSPSSQSHYATLFPSQSNHPPLKRKSANSHEIYTVQRRTWLKEDEERFSASRKSVLIHPSVQKMRRGKIPCRCAHDLLATLFQWAFLKCLCER